MTAILFWGGLDLAIGVLMAWLNRLGGILVSPKSTFRDLIHRNQGGVGDVILLMFLAMLGSQPVETARALLAGSHGVMLTVSKLVDDFMFFALAPLVITLALGLGFAIFQRIRGGKVPLDGLMTASVYLWVPAGVLGLLGAALVEIGWRQSLLPHVPLTIFLSQDPPVWLLAIRLVLSYGWSAVLAWVMLRVISETPPEKKADTEEQAQQRRSRWPAWLMVGLLAGSWLGGGLYSAAHYETIKPILPGEEAPGFTLPQVDGTGSVSLSALRGQPVVVEFWADWCKVCTGLVPWKNSWIKAHPQVKYVAVHQGGSAEDVQEYLKAHPWSGPVFLVDGHLAASRAYRVDTLPTFVVIDEQGKIKAVRVGAPPEHWLEHNLDLSHEGHNH